MEIKQHELGSNIVQYLLDDKGVVGLRIIPKEKIDECVEHREFLEAKHSQMKASRVGSIVQLHLSHHPMPSVSGSYINSESAEKLQYKSQKTEEIEGIYTITTELEAEEGYSVTHRLSRSDGECAFEVQTEFHNNSDKVLRLESLSSFSMGNISPFHDDDAKEAIFLHRLRSSWSLEGRHCVDSLEDLQLENSWGGFNNFNRFGALGSRVVTRFFPFAALEDRKNGVLWGATLHHNASWQIEIGRDLDCAFLCGGQADRIFGHWYKDVAPGESFLAPKAYLAVSTEGFDDLCHKLTQPGVKLVEQGPAIEQDLPIVFNEWCTSWGCPTHDSVLAAADRLSGSNVKYIVLDAGWYRECDEFPFRMGDWNYNREAFPRGIRETCRQLRQRGFIPGVWFEFEIAVEHARIYSEEFDSWYLKRDGQIIRNGERKFLDFSNPEVQAYLQEKVIDFLRDNEFGYMKIDYNGSVGFGCDGAESSGEGLRKHMDNVRQFIEKIRAALPDLVIESCASGGFRLDPISVGISSMSSFSDAHECEEIPILAANVGRMVLPRQLQIWAVLRPSDNDDRLFYTLSATFLGRMCFSGDIAELSGQQMAIANEAQAMYISVSHIIKDGKTKLFRNIGESYRYLTGAQVSVRLSADKNEALVVFHAFHQSSGITASLGDEGFNVKQVFGSNVSYAIEGANIRFNASNPMIGAVMYLSKD